MAELNVLKFMFIAFIIIEIIGAWAMSGIFEYKGEKRWKSIIPFYRHYVFGKIMDEESNGKDAMNYCILYFISMLSLVIGTIGGLSLTLLMENGVLFILMCLLSLFIFVGAGMCFVKYCLALSNVRIKYLQEIGREDMLIPWTICPGCVQIYLALINLQKKKSVTAVE